MFVSYIYEKTCIFEKPQCINQNITKADKSHCNEDLSAFLDLIEGCTLAEMVGFEPTEPIKAQTISSRSRYDHFDTSPYNIDAI